jgi:hypothetical protein
VSSAATLDIVLTSYTAYRGFRLILANLIPATDNVDLIMRSSTDGGSSYDASAGNYMYVGHAIDSGGSAAALASSSQTQMAIMTNLGNGSAEGCSGVIEAFDLPNAAAKARFLWDFSGYQFNDLARHAVGRGLRNAAADVDAIRVLFSSGNIASGKWALYGYA